MMRLVVDANIIFALLITQGKTYEVFFKKDLDLFAPHFLFDEIIKYSKLIKDKSKLADDLFLELLTRVRNKLTLVDAKYFSFVKEKLLIVCPDKDDIAYFALAHQLGLPIWSNDKVLKNQSIVKVITTSELIKLLGDESE